jgi:hypothetical protein
MSSIQNALAPAENFMLIAKLISCVFVAVYVIVNCSHALMQAVVMLWLLVVVNPSVRATMQCPFWNVVWFVRMYPEIVYVVPDTTGILMFFVDIFPMDG